MNDQPAPETIEAFRTLLTRETGLRFEGDKLRFLGELLESRARKAGCRGPGEYLEKLASKSEETRELARLLVVSETYFLRDRGQFRALDAILRTMEGLPSRQLRVLSAGCASGEEAYSLGIVIRETLSTLSDWKVSILGVDINAESLEKAREGIYSNWSLRETPESIRRKYFRQEGSRWVLQDSIREMVRFEEENLVNPSVGLWRYEAFDIVFCRNVLMYLAPVAAGEVVARVARSLSPGGYLFLGHAENLRGISHDFHLRHSHETFYYARRSQLGVLPDDGARAADCPPPEPRLPVLSADTSWFEAIGRASSRIERLSRDSELSQAAPKEHKDSKAPPEPAHVAQRGDRMHPAIDLMKQERFAEALRLLSGATTVGEQRDTLVLRAMLLVSTGDPEGAERLCDEILQIDDLNAGAHYIMSICREHAGDRTGSIEHSQMAAYLDADFAMPHLQLGRLARRGGDTAAAQRELGLALGLLSREDAARIVLFGGGFSREALIEVCRGELKSCGSVS